MTTGNVSATNTSHVSVPGDMLFQAKPYAIDSHQQLEPKIKGAAPQHKPLEHGVDSNEFIGRLEGRSGAKHASHFTSVHSKSTPVSNSSTNTAPVPSVSSLAPPPLSEALRVPGFDVPPSINHQSHSSTSTSTTMPAMSNTLASKPAFDVEAFINSLRKNQPRLGTTSTASSGNHSSSVAMPVSKAGVPLSLSHPQPLSQTQTAKLHPSVVGQKERTIPMADLSVSLVSSAAEDDERDRREYSETMTETSEQTDSSEHKTNSTIHPPVLQRDLPESGVMGHSGPITSAVTEASGSAHIGLPPGYMLQHQGQGLANHKLKPGWFALTSHLSHS